MSAVTEFQPLDKNDYDARNRRATLVLTTSPNLSSSRKFGFWRGFSPENDHLPYPVANQATEQTELLFATLKVIEDKWAGYVSYRGPSTCRICHEAGLRNTNGHREYVFQPLENGFVYRWPEGLMHYYDVHKIGTPMWLTEMVRDYQQAQKQGRWV